MTRSPIYASPSADHHVGRAIGSGILAGLMVGVVMAVLMAIMNAAAGKDVWQGMKFAGVAFLGDRARAPGPDALAVIVGLASHLLVSMVWGALFGVLVFGARHAITVLDGALFGVVVWLGMFYVILPIAGATEARAHASVAQAIGQHVVFGVLLGLGFLPFQQWLPWPSRPLGAVAAR